MIITSNIDNISKKSWADFVRNHPDGNIFQTPDFYDVHSKTKNQKPIVIGAIQKNEIL